MKEKENKIEDNIQKILEEIIAEFGTGKVSLLGKNSLEKKEIISSGSILLDSILLPGEKEAGYVKGKIIEIFGLPSSGKSTLALHAIRECQKLGEKAVLFDLENSVNIKYAKNIGVEVDKLIIPYPSNGEEAFDMISKFIKNEIGLIVVDSVSNLIPRSQLENSLEKRHVGSHAILMSAGLRKLKNDLTNKKTIIIFINQIRKNISTGFFLGSPEVTTGGMALGFDSDVRIKTKFKEKIEKLDKTIGIKIIVKIVKNKLAEPDGTAELDIIYSSGICKKKEIIKLAIDNKIIQKNGN